MTADCGTVITLALDAVDPRLSGDQRTQAFVEAADLDVDMAYTVTQGMAYGLLLFVRDRHGHDALNVVMGEIAERSMVLLEGD